MNSFETHIKGSKPVVVDFFAEWCRPCHLMAPILKEVKDTIGDNATILKMDIDRNPLYMEKYKIHGVPTLIIFKNGKTVWRKTGVPTAREVLDHLSKAIDR